jgi:hypothetical protein
MHLDPGTAGDADPKPSERRRGGASRAENLPNASVLDEAVGLLQPH